MGKAPLSSQWRSSVTGISFCILAELLSRKEHELELDLLKEGWMINYTLEEVMSHLQLTGVIGKWQDGEDIMDCYPHLKYRGHLPETERPTMERFRQMGLPPGFSSLQLGHGALPAWGIVLNMCAPILLV